MFLLLSAAIVLRMNFQLLGDRLVVCEDLFDAREYAIVEQEIAALKPHIDPTYHGSDVVLYRANLDQLYADRKRSFILQAMPDKLYGDDLLSFVESVHDLVYTLLNKQHKFTTVLTEMRSDTDYRRHTDTGAGINWTGIFLSWIWYYNPRPELFSGGELVVEDLDLRVTPKDNRLVLLPAYLHHRIEPAVYRDDHADYYRTTLNGFLKVALA